MPLGWQVLELAQPDYSTTKGSRYMHEALSNYSYIINHILENGKNDDLIYRNMDIHSNVVKYNDTNKDIFLTKNGDTMRVTCNVFLKDISNFFKNILWNK